MKVRKLGLSCLCLAGLLGGISACSPQNTEVDADTISALTERIQYLEDMQAIEKLQATYVHSLFTQRFENIPTLYAREHPDVSVEFSDSGVYRGIDSIERLYGAFDRTTELPGFFILHMAVNPYIEIAEDGLSAKSHWLSPGASNNGDRSSWIWGPYYVDYVKENGQWRILHSNLVPLFRNPYEFSWGNAPDHGSVRPPLRGTDPDEPSTLYRPFNEVKEETDIFRDHPELPEPY